MVRRGIGIPLQSAGSRIKGYREFWDFISELKQSLGPEALPTLKALMEEAESGSWKKLYLTMIVALRQPESVALLTAWSKDPNLDPSQRMIAIYGLGEVGTPAAWQAFQEIWPDIKKGKWETNLLEGDRFGAFAAMGVFGGQGAEMLLREIESLAKEGRGNISWFYLSLVRGAAPDQLLKIAREGANPNLRRAAINVLGEDLDSPASLDAFLGLMREDADPETRKWAASKMSAMLRLGLFSLEGSPEARQRIVSTYSSLPADLRLALHLDPATRNLLPETLEQLASAPATAGSDWWMRQLLGAAFASDPSMHAVLAGYLLAHWKEGALSGAQEAFQARVPSFNDPQLAAVLVKMATDPEFSEVRPMAWDLLAKGPEEARKEALRKAGTAYWSASEGDRVRMIGQLAGSGPDARATLAGLLEQESFPLARIELATVLAGQERGTGLSPELRSELIRDLGPILNGGSDAGIRYITSHPKGVREGLDKFATLVRDYYTSSGTPSQIAEMKSLPDRFFIPQKMLLSDPDTVTSIKEALRGAVLQSIDELRLRYSP